MSAVGSALTASALSAAISSALPARPRDNGMPMTALWSQGEQGAWYDPSDFERYMVKGPELVDNGGFNSDLSGWGSVQATHTRTADGWIKVTAVSTSGAQANQTIAAVPVGRWVELSGNYRNLTATRQAKLTLYTTVDLAAQIGTASAGTLRVTGFIPANTAVTLIALLSGPPVAGDSVEWDNISVRELTAIATCSLFQDAAGTTPVTAMEQPVGLMLDKRLGLVRGPELWDDATVAFGGGSSRVSAGVYRLYSADGTYSTISDVGTTVGKVYEVTGVVDSIAVVGNGITPDVTPQPPAVTTVGAFRWIVTANSTSLFIKRAGGACDFQISNISVREIPGNHASQATTTARPLLSARKNLLTNTAWANSGALPTGWAFGIGAGSAVPDGVDGQNQKYRFSATNDRAWITGTSGSLGTSGTQVWSCVVHEANGGLSIAQIIGATNAPAGSTVAYAIDNVTVAANAVPVAGNRISMALTSGGTSGSFIPRFGIGVQNTVAGTVSYVLSAPQLEYGPTATRYQRVNTATDYDWVGFPTGEKYDGTDDFVTAATGGGGTAGFFYCAALIPGNVATNQILWSDRGTNTGYRVRLTTSGQLELSAGNGTVYTSAGTAATVALGVPVLLTAWDDGTNLNVQLNRGAVNTVARPVVVAGTAGFTEGRDNGAATGYLNGTLLDRVYRHNGGLTAAQREQVQRQVANKAGITL